jgi:AhpD family alkylhydroperoxidase
MKKLSKELAGPVSGFAQLRHESLADGALSRKHKELIALGVAIAARCDACIAYHVHDALRAGAKRQEIVETIGVAMMGGGPATMYGCHAFEALEQFE